MNNSTNEAIEVWRVIPGSQGLYSVSNLGRVRSEPVQTSRAGRRRGRILTCWSDRKGYRQFRMCLPGHRAKLMSVHSAVALAFLGLRPAGAQVNHKSGDKRDNSVSNLEYVSCMENIRHGWQMGLYTADHSRGERNALSKLTTDDVRRIRALHGTVSLSNLAVSFGVTKQAVWQIVKGRVWRHVA